MTLSDPSKPLLRTLADDDLDGLLSLYAYLHEGDDATSSSGILVDTWAKILQDPAHTYVGAFVGGMLCSAANASIVLNLTRGGRPFAVIENVVTHPSHRRRGLAKAVISRLLQLCELAGCDKVMLLSSSSRVEAHSFYRTLGFDGDSKRAFIRRLTCQ